MRKLCVSQPLPFDKAQDRQEGEALKMSKKFLYPESASVILCFAWWAKHPHGVLPKYESVQTWWCEGRAIKWDLVFWQAGWILEGGTNV